MVAVITLTTDFGLRDTYVAEMKAAILSITPGVCLVDLTHEVLPHDITEGALALEAAAPFFPQGTIHVAVVDPEVGTARRGIALASGGHVFIAPDNGLLTPFLARDGWRAWELRAAEYRLPEVSRTFHGRDIFAPAAAHVARGVELHRLGPAVRDPVRLAWPGTHHVRGGLAGAVLHVDRFGNLVTSIDADAVESLGPRVTIRIAGRSLPLVGTYADLPPGRAGALLGSRNRLEVAVREGSAAAQLRARRGTPVVVSRTTSSTKGRARKKS
ncbi:MAG: SAM-dependent chlorinase/fluorinase [Candidatus Rokubacteria bacterium]|nr:SAM-dependent chlorinase/fluorinase [Candidatus Rokubacteria bacterium]